MKELENFRKFLTEESTPEGNKYYTQDEDGDWILDWDAAIDANEWAYNWAATQLNLTIIGDYVPPVPEVVAEVTE